MESFTDVARIISTSHLDGRLALAPRAGLPLLIEEGMRISLVPPKIDLPRTVHVESVERKPDGGAVARFAEVDSIDVAKGLVGMHCLALTDELPHDLMESALHDAPDFYGWRFRDVESGLCGQIRDFWHSGGQDLCEASIDGEPEERLHVFPMSDDFVVDVLEESKELTLKLPKGIFEL